ncbi:glycosyltransferase family 1 protein [Candidatus Microgenomates bacterium]|jgi:glycosyltransferase involved in cell wall biosynthesis|nr:MAG: glycosyltransferase family 1 protein [Candidatus Microgenomates bacterium]
MIRVGIDLTPLNNQSKYRGIGKYTQRLIASLRSVKDIELTSLPNEADIVHYPFFDFFFLTLPFVKPKKTVVTIHDCIPLAFPDQYPPGIKGRAKFLIQKQSLKGVEAVITDSESSKKDIVKYLDYPAEKIWVVYLAADPCFGIVEDKKEKDKIKEKYMLPDKFVLYVGDVNYNKNLSNLIKAYSQVKDKADLVFVGKSFENKTLKEVKEILFLIKELNLEKKVHFPGYIPDSDLKVVYNLASVYCLISLYEGFGLGVLEAMSCGCPVVASKLSSLPEAAGDAALLVDPYSKDEIGKAIGKLLGSKKEREEYAKKGVKRAGLFSWEKVAEETAEVYKKVVKK